MGILYFKIIRVKGRLLAGTLILQDWLFVKMKSQPIEMIKKILA